MLNLVVLSVGEFRLVSRTLGLPCATMIRVPRVVPMVDVVFGFGCMAGRRVVVGV